MNIIEKPSFIKHPQADNTQHAPQFRHIFVVGDGVASANLKICGLGYHQPYLDGVSISDERITPPPTNYLVRSYYSDIDITKMLPPGKHSLMIWVGRGFFAMQTQSVWNYEKSQWTAPPMLFAKLEITYDNGKTECIDADENWQTNLSPITRSSLYTGEICNCGYEACWVNAAKVDDKKVANLKLYPRITDQIKVISEYKPCEISINATGNQIVKFPVVLSGTAHILAKGKAGSTLKARYFESLRPDNTPEMWQEHVTGDIQTDEYIIGESGIVDWEPLFDYKGFQYIELEGDIEPVTSGDIIARQIGSDLLETATFECSNPLFNKIYENSLRTVRNNFCGIPTDTPMYEKNGWLGDSGLISEFACTAYKLDKFWEKWLLDIQDCAEKSGRIRAIAPSISWGDFDAPEWIDTYFEIIWQMYWQYGLTKQIVQHYPTMKQYLEYAQGKILEKGLFKSNLGDWVPPESGNRGGCVPEGPMVSAACYMYKMHMRFTKFAEMMDKKDDVKFSAKAMKEIKAALNEKCLDRDAGMYTTGVSDRFIQSDQLLPLAFDIVPSDMRNKIIENLVADIKRKFNHLDTGILGTKYILPILTKYGHADLAYIIANSCTFPSWGNWIEHGATTNYETWGLDARSRNHYMFGTIVDWFYKDLAGINIQAPAYSKVLIKPEICGNLHSCSASVVTPHGVLSTSWQVVDYKNFVLKINVPPNIMATAILPGEDKEIQLESGYQVLKIEK